MTETVQTTNPTSAPPVTPAPVPKETVASFVNHVLTGTTVAIVIALIPNAILATFLKPLSATSPLAMNVLHVAQVFQFFTPIMAGFLIAHQFKLNPMQMLAVGGAAYLGSGAWVFNPDIVMGAVHGGFQLKGIGDLINTMLTASLAVLACRTIGNKFGSMNIILLPIVIGLGVGFVGWMLLPFVSAISMMIGNAINAFTTLQPYVMCLLIAMSFALLIVSPISTVAIGLAIGISGLSAAAASMGVAATTAVLVWGTLKVNHSGVPLAVALGAMKMMMPNFLKNPIMAMPLLLNAGICSLLVPLLNIVGTPASSGFGLVGLVAPIASVTGGLSVPMMVVAWLVVPFVSGFIINKLCQDVFKLYSKDIFRFQAITN